jgi:hypothetical protein
MQHGKLAHYLESIARRVPINALFVEGHVLNYIKHMLNYFLIGFL